MNRIKNDLLLLKKYDSGEIKTDKSFEDIMNNIVTRFENNAVGVQFHESKQKLFSNETRKKIIDTIINVIRDGSGFEMEKRYNSLRLILQNEVENNIQIKKITMEQKNLMVICQMMLMEVQGLKL